SALGLDSKMGNGCRLDDQSLLPDGFEMKAGEARRGSPAQIADVKVPEGPVASFRRPMLFGLAQLATLYVTAFAFLIPSIPFVLAYWFAWSKSGLVPLVLALLASPPVAVLVYCYFIAILKKLILKKATPGVYSVESVF